jgi:hypothetical protein
MSKMAILFFLPVILYFEKILLFSVLVNTATAAATSKINGINSQNYANKHPLSASQPQVYLAD